MNGDPRAARETILLLHGEPTWGYLYRKIIGPIEAASFRVMVPDLIGFGRSDSRSTRPRIPTRSTSPG